MADLSTAEPALAPAPGLPPGLPTFGALVSALIDEELPPLLAPEADEFEAIASVPIQVLPVETSQSRKKAR